MTRLSHGTIEEQEKAALENTKVLTNAAFRDLVVRLEAYHRRKKEEVKK